MVRNWDESWQIFEKLRPVRIDEYGALIFAFNDFIKSYGQEINFEISVQIIEFNTLEHPPGNLAKRPDALYLINLKVPDKAVVYGIKSNKKIEFKHELSTNWLDF